MIGTVKGTTRVKKQVAGLPAPIASFTTNVKGNLGSLKVAVEAVQAEGTPSPSSPLPISGWNGAVVNRCGKNLFGTGSWYIPYSASNYSLLVGNDTYFVKAGTYRLSFEYKRVDAPSLNSFARIYSEHLTSVDVSKQTQYYSLGLSVADDWTLKTVLISVNQDGWFGLDDSQLKGGVAYRNIQLELGSTATTYEPYNGNTYVIQFGNTYYGGSLNVTTGLLTVTWGNVDLGSLDYQYNASTNIFTSTNMTNFKEPTSTEQRRKGFLCDIYPPSSTTAINVNMDDKSMLRLSGQINIRNTSYSTVETFQTAMSGHQIVYELATPIEIQLTPTEVKTLLGSNNIFADCGDIEELKYFGRQVYYGR